MFFLLRVGSAVATLCAVGAHRVARAAINNSLSGIGDAPLYLEWMCDLGHANCTNSSKMEAWVRNVTKIPAADLVLESVSVSVRIPNKIRRADDYKMYIYKFNDNKNRMSAADLINAARDETVNQFNQGRRDRTLLVGQNLPRNVYFRHHKEKYKGDSWGHWELSLYIQNGTPFKVWAKCDLIQKHSVERTFHWITKEIVTVTAVGYSHDDKIKIPVRKEEGTYVYGWQCFWAKTDDPFAGENSDVTKLGNVGTMSNTDTYGYYKMVGTTKFGGFAEWLDYPAA